MKKLTDRTVLIVDDNADDCFLMGRALDRTGLGLSIHFVTGGEEAVAYLNGDGVYAERLLFPYPSLIITALGMLRGDGFSVLLHLRQNPPSQLLRVPMLSSLDDPDHMRRAYRLGVTLYCVKPQNYLDLLPILSNFFNHPPACDSPLADPVGRMLPAESTVGSACSLA